MPAPAEPSSSLLMLSAALEARAGDLGLAVEANPKVLQEEEHQATLLFRALGANVDAPVRNDLVSRTYLLGNTFAVRLVDLPPAFAPESTEALLSMVRARAALDRSHLGAALEHDLYCFLVAPPGKDTDPEWYRLTHRVSRDERACRKLVWLPPAEASQREDSAQRFLLRTFLARPWGRAEHLPDLDLVRRIADRAGLPSDTIQAMVAVASERQRGQDVIDALLALVRG